MYATVTVKNLAEPDRAWEGEFLVDTGAHHSVVPRQHLEAIGIEPRRTHEFTLAGGSKRAFDVALAEIELDGDFAGATVLFGDDDTQPRLGVVAIEALGLEVDPVRQQLRHSQALHL